LYRSQLKIQRRAKGESIQAIYNYINRLVLLAHPGAPTDHQNDLAVDPFVEALDNEYNEMRVHDKKRPERLKIRNASVTYAGGLIQPAERTTCSSYLGVSYVGSWTEPTNTTL